ncbi:uncharacterized protein LOC118194900 [Stegodyphus dumicola]|uniref:uncharacterized protein LOC118194900 n=1 Tax=Stegodyphus dumicola TaxID=202533 RepID=UPI0015ADAC56|nr:uncharacterized protein LOC118194900 [Stegodyphus dumicola]XP_035222003.1 uncharacterized protein LOC118194900 [Stegodyphus dumicola]
MRQEFQVPAVESEDHYEDSKLTDKSVTDHPMDLRVNSAIQRGNPLKGDSSKSEKKHETKILASLLQKSRSISPAQKGWATHTPGHYSYSRANCPSKNYEHQITLTNTFIRDIPEYFSSSKESSQLNAGQISVNDLESRSALKSQLAYQENTILRRALEQKRNTFPPTNTEDICVVFDSNRELPSAFRRISKDCHLRIESKVSADKEVKEFVPNYRKFYSRCNDQSLASKASVEGITPAQNSTVTDFNHRAVNTRACCPLNESNSYLRAALLTPVNSSSVYFRNNLNSHDAKQVDNMQCLKRKLSAPINTSLSEANRKDETIKHLLAASNEGKWLSLKHTDLTPGLRCQIEKACKDGLRCETHLGSRIGNAAEKSSQMGHQHESGNKPIHVFYSQALRPHPDDVVLKGLLITNPKVGAPVLPTSGPPSSGSPGSESTSSGSTDSGVFSDTIPDERRRITRVLSGRHVKSGTGASLSTLRLLRQMIIERRRRKNDRKL